MRTVFQPTIHFITHRILHVDDSPRRIAMGIVGVALTGNKGACVISKLSCRAVAVPNKRRDKLRADIEYFHQRFATVASLYL